MRRKCCMSGKIYFIEKELPLNRGTKSNSSAARMSHTSTRANVLPIQIKVCSSTVSLWNRRGDVRFKCKWSSFSSRFLTFLYQCRSFWGRAFSFPGCLGQDHFDSLIFFHLPFISFSCCIALAKTSSAMSNEWLNQIPLFFLILIGLLWASSRLFHKNLLNSFRQ